MKALTVDIRMRFSYAFTAGAFPASNVTDTLYSTPESNVLIGSGEYGTYDYCSMPHPRSDVYSPVKGATLQYVDYIQRHQRRTPYNLLEGDVYDCSDVHLVTGTNLLGSQGSIQISIDNSSIGTCQFPQLTHQGIQDAFVHGQDLWDVYGGLGLLPRLPDQTVRFRVSNSKLTESTAQNLIFGLWPGMGSVLLHQQPGAVDTINSGFSCDARDDVKANQMGSDEWLEHLRNFNETFEALNSTGITKGFASSKSWTNSLDHLCDNFQSKICNNYELPVDNKTVDRVFAGGDWEWDFRWRNSTNSTASIKTTEGLFIKEIVNRLQDPAELKYSHTFGHDGDIGPLAGALGISYLRWPGMASNIAIEVWTKDEAKIVRVLYCGAPIRSTWVQNEHPFEDFIAKLSKYVLDIKDC